MALRHRLRRSVAMFAFLAPFSVASCTSASSPSPTVCNGISSEMGGCSAERHDFIGASCEALAREWATILDRAVVAVLDGRRRLAIRPAPRAFARRW